MYWTTAAVTLTFRQEGFLVLACEAVGFLGNVKVVVDNGPDHGAPPDHGPDHGASPAMWWLLALPCCNSP